MKKEQVEELREKVGCGAVLEEARFAVDVKESTRRAVKHRRGPEIIIVIHGGRGWFDPLSDAKGDVFALVEHLDGASFQESLERVAQLVGYDLAEPQWRPLLKDRGSFGPTAERWESCV
ncbi:hypothetical protein GGE43_004079 [Agrobacterium tumefaciens]|uniref:DUF3991 domain-containing protein n=1 Tax=Agrobacterium radiobacter TaxID=362 RepID=A0ABR6JCH2_AGRRD|nr:hypothetical protein [Agrobacterium radiobacter]MBB4320468.1 hypothetical protein [Agrobacterium radiobacter]MBB4337133.1 hypothetical protein [Agrobacterium radiobacter]MBB4492619.1 hypothetical protein [Agrobacterium radiobacter]MBB4497517.1 hypothetical protein [Agrobacterium radiobacter]MBB4502572.1 hypothetical protein [Agrobacterium radiobacter]